MPKTKSGEEITWKEFGKRWKKGIEGITPLQQLSMAIRSTWIILIGITCGIVICVMNFKTLWWLLIVLIGGFFNTIVTLIGQYQKYWFQQTFTRFEDFLPMTMEQLEDNKNEEPIMDVVESTKEEE